MFCQLIIAVVNAFQTILIALLSLLRPVMSSFGGGHDHGHGHDHGDDIHSGHFCWDISKWGDIFYKEVTVEVCDNVFEKKCKDVPQTVMYNLVIWLSEGNYIYVVSYLLNLT